MSTYDPILYEAPVNTVVDRLHFRNPLVGEAALIDLAEDAVAALLDEGYLPEPENCEWRSSDTDARCDDLAPLRKFYCINHQQ